MSDPIPKSRREIILGTIDDLVTDLLCYDRKYDHALPRGAIDEAVKVGEISIDDMVEAFRQSVTKGVEA